MSYIANSFFHYTKSADILLNIIRNGFFPRFCIEDYDFLLENHTKNKTPTKIGVPIVCFCDIPLTSITEHTASYGSFGIGMKYEWGVKHLNPVFYTNQNSIPGNMLINLQYILLKPDEDVRMSVQNNKMLPDQIKSLLLKALDKRQESVFRWYQDFIAFLKKYNDTDSKKIFYREREWRWLLTNDKIDNDIPFRLLPEDLSQKEEYNKKIEQYALKFDLDDVSCLIVKTTDDKVKLVKQIYELDKPPEDKKLNLITNIISLEEINQNF